MPVKYRNGPNGTEIEEVTFSNPITAEERAAFVAIGAMIREATLKNDGIFQRASASRGASSARVAKRAERDAVIVVLAANVWANHPDWSVNDVARELAKNRDLHLRQDTIARKLQKPCGSPAVNPSMRSHRR